METVLISFINNWSSCSWCQWALKSIENIALWVWSFLSSSRICVQPQEPLKWMWTRCSSFKESQQTISHKPGRITTFLRFNSASDTLYSQFPDRASDGVATNCVVYEVLGVSTGDLAWLRVEGLWMLKLSRTVEKLNMVGHIESLFYSCLFTSLRSCASAWRHPAARRSQMGFRML